VATTLATRLVLLVVVALLTIVLAPTSANWQPGRNDMKDSRGLAGAWRPLDLLERVLQRLHSLSLGMVDPYTVPVCIDRSMCVIARHISLWLKDRAHDVWHRLVAITTSI
jgi:hypothetical protein